MTRRFTLYRCKFCQEPMFVTRYEYRENPYCNKCFHVRLAKAASDDPVVGWQELDSGYMKPVRLSELQGKREPF